MDNELIVYRSFASMDDAEVVADILGYDGIIVEVTVSPKILNTVLVGIEYDNNIDLKIKAVDFDKANKLLLKSNDIDIENIDKDHPLFTLNNDELRDVVAKPDEWGHDNYIIAKQLLAKRGINISDSMLHQMEEDRFKILKERKGFSFSILLLGYVVGLIDIVFIITGHQFYVVKYKGLWLMPGFFGIILGVLLLQAKTTLPNGERISTYNNSTIKHAIAITLINILAWIVNIVILMFWL